MIFTQEQMEEIGARLVKTGTPDTAFPVADFPLTGDEIFGIVQDGENKKITLNNIAEAIELSSEDTEKPDFFNVSRYSDPTVALTLAQAIEACPSAIHKSGQYITFIGSIDEDENPVWETWQFTSEDTANWETESYWKKIYPTAVSDSGDSVVIESPETTIDTDSLIATLNESNHIEIGSDGNGNFGNYYYEKDSDSLAIKNAIKRKDHSGTNSNAFYSEVGQTSISTDAASFGLFSSDSTTAFARLDLLDSNDITTLKGFFLNKDKFVLGAMDFSAVANLKSGLEINMADSIIALKKQALPLLNFEDNTVDLGFDYDDSKYSVVKGGKNEDDTCFNTELLSGGAAFTQVGTFVSGGGPSAPSKTLEDGESAYRKEYNGAGNKIYECLGNVQVFYNPSVTGNPIAFRLDNDNGSNVNNLAISSNTGIGSLNIGTSLNVAGDATQTGVKADYKHVFHSDSTFSLIKTFYHEITNSTAASTDDITFRFLGGTTPIFTFDLEDIIDFKVLYYNDTTKEIKQITADCSISNLNDGTMTIPLSGTSAVLGDVIHLHVQFEVKE